MPTAAEVFMNALAKQTGVDPGLIGYWINQEGTYAPRGTGGFNFLNMRPKGTPGAYSTWSGVPLAGVSPGRFEQFQNVQDAIQETVNRINQPFMNPLRQAVAAGASPAEQWRALQKTGWDIANYKGSQFTPTTQITDPGPDASGAGLPAAAAADPAAAAASSPDMAAQAIAFARKYMGTPYSWGGGSPEGPTYGTQQGADIKGFDCSGLVQSAYEHAGLKASQIGDTTFDQFFQGTPVAPGQLQPGDVVFFKGSDPKVVNGKELPGHEALYIGNNKFIEAPYTHGYIRVQDMSSRDDYMGARRFAATPAEGVQAATNATSKIGQDAKPQSQAKQEKPVQAKPLGGVPIGGGPVPVTSPVGGNLPFAQPNPHILNQLLNTPTPHTFTTPTPVMGVPSQLPTPAALPTSPFGGAGSAANPPSSPSPSFYSSPSGGSPTPSAASMPATTFGGATPAVPPANPFAAATAALPHPAAFVRSMLR